MRCQHAAGGAVCQGRAQRLAGSVEAGFDHCCSGDEVGQMKLIIPNMSLIVLVGASGSGKSTFARKHFKPTEVLSSDFCRGLVADDENDQAATGDAFDVLHYIAAKRLAAGKLTVVDATNVQAAARKPLLAFAREYHT